MKYQKLSKKAISCMFVAGIVQFIIVGVMFGVGMYIGREEWVVLLIGGIVLGLDLLYVLISPKVRYERYRYILNEEEIDVMEGFIFTKRNIVPIERLHKIAVLKGPIDRVFGLAKVVVTTAGGDVTVRFMEDEKADQIAESLKNRINEISLDEKNQMAQGE
ncbi:MAG: PH domain-containing protein [Lachnospiraceae bacterium]|nr:PH domain-containing protein [Lachnospiraceae bacterium]